MQRDSSLANQQQDYINIINRSGEHLLELINDILEMTKIESGRISYHENIFDFWIFLKDLEQMLRVRADSKNLKLSFKYDRDVPQFITTDKGKLRQILINLLGNALKFTDTGTVSLRVRSGLVPEISTGELIGNDDRFYLTFEVEDTGVGIHPDEIGQLFKPFSQSSSGLQSGEGTGLGLPISRKFIQLMGGDIRVSSVVNQGSQFLFFIPYQPVTTEYQKPSRIPAASGSSQEHRALQYQHIKSLPIRPKILAVEDNATNRLLLVKMLTAMGFEVQEAENGQVAIDLWESWCPDLILMDMRMPVLDGYRATQEIKKRPGGESTIIIALTASAFEEQRQQILNVGCDDFVRKPFNADALLETIARYLNLEILPQKLDHSSPTISVSPTVVFTEFDCVTHLKSQSSPWLEKLYQAASQGSDDRLLTLLEELPAEEAPLKQHLKTLVLDFRFDRILELVA